MVYESDFYTVRRPYSRPTITSYSVTGCRPILSMRNYIAPSGTHSRVRLSVLMGELNRIQHRSRPHWSYVPTEDFLCSRALVCFDDEAKRIRAAADRIMRYVYTRVPHRTSHLPGRMITTYDRYAPEGRYTSKYFGTVPDDILSMSYYYDPARVTIGRGHLSCVSYAGGRGYPRRKHLYTDEYRDINDEIKFRSYYNKIMHPNRTEDALLLPTGFASRLLLADRHLTGPDEGRAIIFKTKLTKPAPFDTTLCIKDKPKDKASKKDKNKKANDDKKNSNNWMDSQVTTPKIETAWMKTEDDTVKTEDVFQEAPAQAWTPEETPVKEKRKKSLSKKKSVDEFKIDEPRKSSYTSEVAPSLTRQVSQPSEPAPTLSRQTSQTSAKSYSRQTSQKVEQEEEVAHEEEETMVAQPEPAEERTPELLEDEPTSPLVRQTSVKADEEPTSTLSRQTSVKADEEPTSTLSRQTSVKADEEPTSTLSRQTSVKADEEPTSTLIRQTSLKIDEEPTIEEAAPTSAWPADETESDPHQPDEPPTSLSRQISQKSEVPQHDDEEGEAAKAEEEEPVPEPVTVSLSRKTSTTSDAAPTTVSRKASAASEAQPLSRKASATVETQPHKVQEDPAKDELDQDDKSAEIETVEVSDNLTEKFDTVNENKEEEMDNDKITEDEPEQEISQPVADEIEEVTTNGLNERTVEEEIVQIEGGYITTKTSVEVKSYHQETTVTSEQSEDDGQTDEGDASTAVSPEPLVEEPASPY